MQLCEKTKVSRIPHGEINFKSADGSPREISGYIRFDLTLGRKTMPMEALILPTLGPDAKAFGEKLDETAQTFSFIDSDLTSSFPQQILLGSDNA